MKNWEKAQRSKLKAAANMPPDLSDIPVITQCVGNSIMLLDTGLANIRNDAKDPTLKMILEDNFRIVRPSLTTAPSI